MKFFEKYSIFEYSLSGHLSAMGWLWFVLFLLICVAPALVSTWVGWLALGVGALSLLTLLIWDIRFRYRHTLQYGAQIIREWVETAPSNEEFETRKRLVTGVGLYGALHAAQLNIDGTPMVGNSPFDINGNIFGVTSYDAPLHYDPLDAFDTFNDHGTSDDSFHGGGMGGGMGGGL